MVLKLELVVYVLNNFTLVATTTMSSPRLVVSTPSGSGQSSSSPFSRSSDRFREDLFIGDEAVGSNSSPGSVYLCHFCTCCFLLCSLCSGKDERENVKGLVTAVKS